MPIPKIIHQTYKNYNLPVIYKNCQNEIKRLNPDFEYRFYTDQDIDKFMKDNFQEYYDKFNELPRKIMKIDMFRYFLMYKFGGLYADLDYLMLKPFDLTEKKIVLPSNREDEIGNPICLGNCIFASEAQHPFWKYLMNSLFSINRTKFDYEIDDNITQNILGTGPMFVYHSWKNLTEFKNDIYIAKRNLFHPPTNNNEIYIKELRKNGSYGMHMSTGVWRNRTIESSIYWLLKKFKKVFIK